MGKALVQSPIFGILLSLLAFEAGILLQRKTKIALFNPLLVGMIITISVLMANHIDLADFNRGGQYIQFFLGPATVVLAVPLYKQRALLKRHWLAILAGITLGSTFSIALMVLLARWLGFDKALVISLIPKSVTTPIGMEVSRSMGGIPELTVAAIIFTGITGAMLAPSVLALFKVSHPVAKGIAIGTSSHAVGTTKAMEMGEVEGAMSSLSIGIAGLVTVILAPLLYALLGH